MEHIYCLNTNTARSAGVSLASGRLNRIYLTQLEKDALPKNHKGVVYLIQPGTVEEMERNFLENKK